MWDQQAENQIWLRFVQGDVQAFQALYKQYFPILYRYGSRLYQDEELIEDCLHDFFLYLYNSRSNLAETR